MARKSKSTREWLSSRCGIGGCMLRPGHRGRHIKWNPGFGRRKKRKSNPRVTSIMRKAMKDAWREIRAKRRR